MQADVIRAAIRDIPDFPKPGILFKDITPILADPALFRGAIDLFVAQHREDPPELIAAIEARGFLFAAALADRLGIGLVPIRKQGKLPYRTLSQSYDLEYGSATLELHADAFPAGSRVLLIDDLLATGGSAAAAIELIEKAGGRVVGVDFLIELAFLKGRERLTGQKIFAPIVF